MEEQPQKPRAQKQKKKPKTTQNVKYSLKAGGQVVSESKYFPSLESKEDEQLQEIALQQAQALKERLLEYDAHSLERTRVTDLASDFSFESKWDSLEVRALKAQRLKERLEREESNRRQHIITLDFENQSVVSEMPQVVKEDVDQEVRTLEKHISRMNISEPTPEEIAARPFYNRSQKFKPSYIEA